MSDFPSLTHFWIVVVVFLSGIVQGGLGFGYAIAALTTLPFLLTPQSAHIVISLSGIPVMAMAAWTSREGTDWKTIRSALLGGALLLPVGLLTFGALSADWLIRLTGLAILILMLIEVRKWFWPVEQSDQQKPKVSQSAFVAGAISGFLAGAVSIGGPPIVAYAVRQDWTPMQAKAFMTRCLLLIAILKGFGLLAGQFLNQYVFLGALIAMPSAIAGVWLGAAISRRIPAGIYRKVTILLLTVISSWWLYRGV